MTPKVNGTQVLPPKLTQNIGHIKYNKNEYAMDYISK